VSLATAVRPSPEAPARLRSLIQQLAPAVCISAAVVVLVRQPLLLVAVPAVLGALALGLVHWRWSLYGLLVFLPVSGIPIIATYPNTQVAVLLKDILFVIPAYMGFLVSREPHGWSFPGAPVLLLAGFAALVGIEMIPGLSNVLVPLIGAKVWLFYIPLLFLGYHLLDSRAQASRLLAVMSAVGMIPLVLGIVEAALLNTGRATMVYSWYGLAASSATQEFARVGGVGLGVQLFRVPSTFSFVTQYYDFCSAMVVVTFAWWQLSGRRWRAALWGVSLVASFTSGARSAFIMTPFLVSLLLLLGSSLRRKAVLAAVLSASVLTAGTVLGLGAGAAVSGAAQVGVVEVGVSLVAGLPAALRLTLVGLGTGQATQAAHYALGAQTVGWNSYLMVSESWWVKAVLELGLAGLAVVVALATWVLVLGYRSHARLLDPTLRCLSGGLLAFLVWTFVFLTKGYVIDLDPVNVYFWLFAGILFGLPRLEASPDRPSGAIREPAPRPARGLPTEGR
jgi:hypothetical protein